MSVNQNQRKRHLNTLVRHQKEDKLYIEYLEHERTQLIRQVEVAEKHLKRQERRKESSSTTTTTDSDDDDSSSSSSFENSSNSELSVDIADAITVISFALTEKKFDVEPRRTLLLNKIENLPKTKIFSQPPIQSSEEMRRRIKESLKCLAAICHLVEVDDDIYHYTLDTLDIFKPRNNNNQLSVQQSIDPASVNTITEFLKPLVISQRNGQKKKDNQEIVRLNAELTKVNKLLLSTLRDKIAVEKMHDDSINEYTQKIDVYKKLLKKSVNHANYVTKKYDQLIVEKNNECKVLLEEVATLKETIERTKTCGICYEPGPVSVCVPCGHVFCADCINSFKSRVCAICRSTITQSVVIYYS